MLSGVEKSKVVEGHFASPSASHPYSVKSHVENLPEEKKKPVRQELSAKLLTMLYVKNLEEMLTLYDLFDHKEEKDSLTNSFITKSFQLKPLHSFIISSISCLGFLRFKKCPLFHFDSYLQNIYPLTAIFGFTYLYSSYAISSMMNKKYQPLLMNSAIILAKSQIHSECVTLTNRLRFNFNEVK